jgi:WD40 repeat protein
MHAVAIAPDGTWLAIAGSDRTVRIWDAATGTPRTALTGHTDRVNAVAIAPDGGWLATAGEDRTVRIWSVADHTCVALMRVERPLTCCAWNTQDNRLMSGGQGGLYCFEFNKLPGSVAGTAGQPHEVTRSPWSWHSHSC